MTTLRSILLHLDAAPASKARLDFARALALRHEATLAAMFVASPLPLPLQLVSESPAVLLQTMDQAALSRAKAVFDAELAQGGPPMRWVESEVGNGAEAFCRQALYADLLVLGQAEPAAAAGSAPPGFVESVLFSSGKPALVLPFTSDVRGIGRDVLIGWNATPQAARAVTAALPWLRGARRVHVLEAIEVPAQRGAGELDISAYLHAHGVVPALHRHRVSPAEAGNMLLSLAADVDADLLVMGCYGRGRTREWVLGGASRTVLETMTLPVLMAH